MIYFYEQLRKIKKAREKTQIFFEMKGEEYDPEDVLFSPTSLMPHTAKGKWRFIGLGFASGLKPDQKLTLGWDPSKKTLELGGSLFAESVGVQGIEKDPIVEAFYNEEEGKIVFVVRNEVIDALEKAGIPEQVLQDQHYGWQFIAERNRYALAPTRPSTIDVGRGEQRTFFEEPPGGSGVKFTFDLNEGSWEFLVTGIVPILGEGLVSKTLLSLEWVRTRGRLYVEGHVVQSLPQKEFVAQENPVIKHVVDQKERRFSFVLRNEVMAVLVAAGIREDILKENALSLFLKPRMTEEKLLMHLKENRLQQQQLEQVSKDYPNL